LRPTAYGAYPDSQRITGHRASVDETVEYLKRQVRAAKTLGFPVVRVGPFEETFQLLPYAEKLGIKLGMEIHAPFSIEGLQDVVRRVEHVSSAYLGFLPDCGAFCRSPSHVFVERFLSQGADPRLVKHIVDRWADHIPIEELRAEVREMGGDEHMDMMAFESGGYFGHSEPSALNQIMPYIVHVHGKFFGIDDAGNESAVRMPEVIKTLRDGGYSGYVSCEYEGHHWFPERDAFDQIQKLQALIRKLL
jgi:sugar phosphate isomerase/epimerase